MFGKLLKYDFRSMLKQFAFVWPAALVLALVNRFTLTGLWSASAVGETTAGIMMLVYIAILVAMFVLAVIFIIQRFYKGLLGDEGYLMHTLPVKSWQLIGSKLLCAVVVTIASVLVAILSIVLIIPFELSDFPVLAEGLDAIIHADGFASSMVELFLSILLDMVQGFLLLYLSMAIGHLFNKNRVIWSVAAYIIISSVLPALMSPIYRVLTPHTYSESFNLVGGILVSGVDGLGEITAGPAWEFWVSLALSAVISSVYFVITNYILSKKLNLE